MAERTGPGENWGPSELDAIVADYFAMLADELAQRPYVKSHHRSVLVQQIGRSAASVEFKHRNISAVLQELGLPWIWGYKPALNYQDLLFDAVDRFLSGHTEILEHPRPPVPSVPDDVFVEMPTMGDPVRNSNLERLVRKFDPVERDFRNRRLGRAGEEFVIHVERRRLVTQDRADLARKVRWISEEDGDGAGFDVLSFDATGKERFIEVKTTNGGARTPFFMTRNELAVAKERADRWQLYRVHLFAQRPAIYLVRPPLEASLRLNPETWKAVPTGSALTT